MFGIEIDCNLISVCFDRHMETYCIILMSMFVLLAGFQIGRDEIPTTLGTALLYLPVFGRIWGWW